MLRRSCATHCAAAGGSAPLPLAQNPSGVARDSESRTPSCSPGGHAIAANGVMPVSFRRVGGWGMGREGAERGADGVMNSLLLAPE